MTAEAASPPAQPPPQAAARHRFIEQLYRVLGPGSGADDDAADIRPRTRDHGRTERAILKRQIGRTLGEADPEALSLFYRLQPPEGQEEELAFLVATLFALHPKALTRPAPDRRPSDFGWSMRQLKAGRLQGQGKPGQGRTDPLDRRMAILLDAQFDHLYDAALRVRQPAGGEMALRLRQALRLLAQSERPVGVDWRRLLDDLTAWPHPDRRVQKAWARSYFSETLDHTSSQAAMAADTNPAHPLSGD